MKAYQLILLDKSRGNITILFGEGLGFGGQDRFWRFMILWNRKGIYFLSNSFTEEHLLQAYRKLCLSLSQVSDLLRFKVSFWKQN